MHVKWAHFYSERFGEAGNSKFGGTINAECRKAANQPAYGGDVENMAGLLLAKVGSRMPDDIQGAEHIHVIIPPVFRIGKFFQCADLAVACIVHHDVNPAKAVNGRLYRL